MPLGLLPDMDYEEAETTLACGESLLMISDGLVEAHDPKGEMYGFPRLIDWLKAGQPGSPLAAEIISKLITALYAFTGPAWEQEDDITCVSLVREAGA
jgi:serine phosphatase RsbU (regulator of sigma subunit)